MQPKREKLECLWTMNINQQMKTDQQAITLHHILNAMNSKMSLQQGETVNKVIRIRLFNLICLAMEYEEILIAINGFEKEWGGQYSERIDIPVNVSRNDVLYMALGFAKRDNFTHIALQHALDLLNTMLAVPVLPATVHLLDAFLFDKTSAHYFFYCSSCHNGFGELYYEVTKTHTCPVCETLNIISDLRKAKYFVIFDVPAALEALLCVEKVRESLSSPAELVGRSQEGLYSDVCDGKIYKDLVAAVADWLASKPNNLILCNLA